MRIRSTLVACLMGFALVACQSTGSLLDSKAKRGAVLGTLAGAVAGAAIGGHDHRAGGALIGAATGAIAGGLIGKYLDKQANELDAIPGAKVERREDSILVNFQSQLLFDSDSSSLNPRRTRSVVPGAPEPSEEAVVVRQPCAFCSQHRVQMPADLDLPVFLLEYYLARFRLDPRLPASRASESTP